MKQRKRARRLWPRQAFRKQSLWDFLRSRIIMARPMLDDIPAMVRKGQKFCITDHDLWPSDAAGQKLREALESVCTRKGKSLICDPRTFPLPRTIIIAAG